MEILSAFHQPRSNYGNCEQTAGAIGNNTRTCRGFYADARENHTLYILQPYLLQLITALLSPQSWNRGRSRRPFRIYGAERRPNEFMGEIWAGWQRESKIKAQRSRGWRVTGSPPWGEGGGGTSASVVSESDQSLLFNKDTETLKCCFMRSGSGFRARR